MGTSESVTGSSEATPRPPDRLWMSYDPELDVWFQSSAPPNCYKDEGITEPPTFYVRGNVVIAEVYDPLIAQRDALVEVLTRAEKWFSERNILGGEAPSLVADIRATLALVKGTEDEK